MYSHAGFAPHRNSTKLKPFLRNPSLRLQIPFMIRHFVFFSLFVFFFFFIDHCTYPQVSQVALFVSSFQSFRFVMSNHAKPMIASSKCNIEVRKMNNRQYSPLSLLSAVVFQCFTAFYHSMKIIMQIV